MAYLTLVTGLLISAVAIFYSVAGLTSIFSAAVLPIIIMGTVLEVSKLVATVWVKQNWDIAPKLLKGYLLGAIIILMFITSMGIFGFLSKAHSDQTLVSGDVLSKIAVYDEKIKTAKDNIEANRKALAQLDAAVDQVMARSTTEGGADKAVAIRRGQAKERARLQAEIAAEQKVISSQQELRAPIAAEVRKVEAEVGPIKYIAAFVYGDTTESILEKAVTWVIILIVIVFDPLAVMLLLASQYSFALLRRKDEVVPVPQEIFDRANELVKDVEVDLDKPLPDDEEEFFEKARDVVRSIDGGYYVAPVYPPSSTVTSWTTTTYDPEPEEDLEEVNRQLAEAKETYEPDDGPLTDEQIEQIREMAGIDLPKGEVVTKDSLFPEEEFPFRGKGIQPSMPLTASYTQPREKEPVVEESIIEDSNLTITHNYDGMVVGFLDGSTQEIYVEPNPMAMDERPGDYVESDNTYVQNEEQKESDTWTKIVNKTITEEEYLKAVQQKKNS